MSQIIIVCGSVIGATFNGLLPTKVITFRGMPLLLLCHAYGFPPPQFLWSKLSGSAFFNATEGEYLVIPELEVNDAGRYQCMIRTILSDGTVYKNISDYTDIRVIGKFTYKRIPKLYTIIIDKRVYRDWKREGQCNIGALTI